MDYRKFKSIDNEEMLDDLLSVPRQELIDMMSSLDGDIMILGIAGKMGMTLGRLAKRAVEAAGVSKKIYGVARFSNEDSRRVLEKWGIETLKCDLLDPGAVAGLPEVANVIYMAGKKFGTNGAEELTWAMNTTAPAYVAQHFKNSRIVVFSTGCVYPWVSVESSGCTERVAPAPVGEYAQSCLGRERVFGHFSKQNGTRVLLYRLNYAIDLRYGVLSDIASRIWADQPVNTSVQHFNVIWQGDANNYALLCLRLCGSPAQILNITGPELVSLRHIAEEFGQLFNKKVEYCGTPGELSYLNNASKSFELFGYPNVSLPRMLQWQAEWIMNGGKCLNKPTHFETNDGKF
ncbi:MAG: NAD-dependent epimerase/dehydratase family protein [Victivallales bacterium]|nr:NAD-dependent epimerase/dehydratase family protein [Victivallales bacterium]